MFTETPGGDLWTIVTGENSLPELKISFGSGGNGLRCLGRGWSDPESGETWATGGTSQITLPAPPCPATYIMSFRLRPHIVAGKLDVQRLRVLVNNVEVGQFTLSKPGVRACRIPWSAIKGRPVLDISWEMPDASRPDKLVSGSKDSRALSIAFTSLAVFAESGTKFDGGDSKENAIHAEIDIDTIAQADRISVNDLMLKFESLGQNCEFGLVQRKCGAEPLGLLRFSSTPLTKLLAALDARFEGMGHPDAVQVQVSANGRELMISDTRFGFLYHAFVKHGEMNLDTLHAREVKRVPRLVTKLLEDLQAAEKIFVFKGMSALPEEEVFPLAASLRRYGPNTLLFVTLADAKHAAGTIEFRSPGFLVGYLARFAPTEDAADFDLAPWVRICREAFRIQLAAKWLIPTHL